MLEINKIYCRDNVEGMRDLDAGSVELIITSPPYNANKEFENFSSLQDYVEFSKTWVREIPRVLSDNGSFWLNVGYTKTGNNTTLPLTYLFYQIVELPLIQEVVWHYEGGMSYKKRFTHRTDRWMWFSKNPDNVIFNLDSIRDLSLNRTTDKRNNPLGKNPTDYWYFDRVVNISKERTEHPTQFPEKMVERIVKACSNHSGLVLDPFMGSGTTAVVAKRLSRNFIGFDISERYCNMANERLDKTDI